MGAFALYGVHVTLAATAVLTYRLFQLAIPALLGAPAFVMLRRKLARGDQPAQLCVPFAAELVELPVVKLPVQG